MARFRWFSHPLYLGRGAVSFVRVMHIARFVSGFRDHLRFEGPVFHTVDAPKSAYIPNVRRLAQGCGTSHGTYCAALSRIVNSVQLSFCDANFFHGDGHMGFVDDYGGNAYGGRRRNKRSSSLVSMRCRDCQTLRFVSPRELTRASSPRCMKCGGPLEELDVSRKRQGLPAVAKAMKTRRSATRRCPACGSAIDNNEFLYRHLLCLPDCVEYHRAEGKCLAAAGSDVHIIPGTVHIIRTTGSRPWRVMAVTSEGGIVELRKESALYLCKQYINEEFGPVELAR